MYVADRLGGVLAGYRHALDIDGYIYVLSEDLSSLEGMIGDVETLLVGDECAVRIVTEINKALAHLRAHIGAVDDMAFTGRPC